MSTRSGTVQFGKLAARQQTWKIYGYSGIPLTANDFPDTMSPDQYGEIVAGFSRFTADAAAGQLPAFSYLEPEWATYHDEHDFRVENDQHPVSNLAVGEKFLYDIYQALRNSPTWDSTLLIITYDEHGGNFDHIPPPTRAIPPDNILGHGKHGIGQGFDFTRYGVRVPAVIVSPRIPAGTILRAPATGRPFDHTSIIATLRARFGIEKLGARDADAPDVGAILSLQQPRTDDPLAGITPPIAPDPTLDDNSPPIGAAPSSFLTAKAIAAAALPVPAARITDPETAVAGLPTAADQYQFIQQRLAAWYEATHTKPEEGS